jgi:hypothetical protein
MLAALLRAIFNADTGEQARELVSDAPAEHWPKLRSTNPLERGYNEGVGPVFVPGTSMTPRSGVLSDRH